MNLVEELIRKETEKLNEVEGHYFSSCSFEMTKSVTDKLSLLKTEHNRQFSVSLLKYFI